MQISISKLKIELYCKLIDKLEEEITAADMLILCGLASDEEIIKEIKTGKLKCSKYTTSLLNKKLHVTNSNTELMQKC